MNNYVYIYLNLFSFLKKVPTKILFIKLNLNFSNNYNHSIIKPLFKGNFPFFFLTSKTTKFINLLQVVFSLKKNILFVDYDFNFNYLPITNSSLFSRSSKNFNKYLKFFDINVILFINLKKKKYIFKKLFSKKTINISAGYHTHTDKFDLSLNLSENKVTHYILYILILKTYLLVKNKDRT